MATLAQLKLELGIISLDLSQSLDKDKKFNGWLRYWNNKTRIAVVVHQDVVAKIKANPGIDTLALKHEAKTTKTGEAVGTLYDNYVLINATSIVAVL